jgi:hypothetical protein
MIKKWKTKMKLLYSSISRWETGDEDPSFGVWGCGGASSLSGDAVPAIRGRSNPPSRRRSHPTWTFSVRGPLIRLSARRRSTLDTRPLSLSLFLPRQSCSQKKNLSPEGASVFRLREMVMAGKF